MNFINFYDINYKSTSSYFVDMQFLRTKLFRSTNLLNKYQTFCIQYQNYGTRKRFYRSTGIVSSDKKWEVTLDHRRLKTPNGRVLTVENESLARAIAAEWDAQIEHISQPTMHLTAICNTALDNPGKRTTHDIVHYILEFLSTDTLLFHSDEEEELKAMQEKKWGPVLDWYQKTFDVKQEVSRDLQPPPVATHTRAVVARHLLSFNFPALNAICFGVEALKSPVLMLACIHKYLEPNEAVMLARLEEEYQLARWGRVPWAHELSQAELTARVAAAGLVVRCTTEQHTATAKTRQGEQNIPTT